ncbi:hypothetical protein EVAR_57618_1 [Eumeta japonica]|uniref:Uncharacterized protein n=1 Tax=Eumeta variegata TaxID=151549 RepID=A0A4C1Y0H0_EUMVA|nr:hypothetical protein EVAR_57618_1 [Eumeta japonica]
MYRHQQHCSKTNPKEFQIRQTLRRPPKVAHTIRFLRLTSIVSVLITQCTGVRLIRHVYHSMSHIKPFVPCVGEDFKTSVADIVIAMLMVFVTNFQYYRTMGEGVKSEITSL